MLNSGSRLWLLGSMSLRVRALLSAALPAQMWASSLCKDGCKAKCGSLTAQVVLAACSTSPGPSTLGSAEASVPRHRAPTER